MKVSSSVVSLSVMWFGVLRGAVGTYSSDGAVPTLPSTAPNDCSCQCLCPYHYFNIPPVIIANNSAVGVVPEPVQSKSSTSAFPPGSSATQQYMSSTQTDGSLSLVTPWPPGTVSPTYASQQDSSSGSQPSASSLSASTAAPVPETSTTAAILPESSSGPGSNNPAPIATAPPESITTGGTETSLVTTTTGLDVNSVPLYSALTLRLGG